MSMCRQEEFVAIVSAMQASENNGGAYDPTRKFHYGLSSSNNVVNDSQQQKVVTEECRARMLNWCLDVSISSTMIDDICMLLHILTPLYIFLFVYR